MSPLLFLPKHQQMLPLHIIVDSPDVVLEVPSSPYSAVWLTNPARASHLSACIVSGEWVPTEFSAVPWTQGVVRNLVLDHDGPFKNVVGVSHGDKFVLCSPLKIVQFSVLDPPGKMHMVYIWEVPMHLAATFPQKGISETQHTALTKMGIWTRSTYNTTSAGIQGGSNYETGRVSFNLQVNKAGVSLVDHSTSRRTLKDIIGGGKTILWASNVELVANDEGKTEAKTTNVVSLVVDTPEFGFESASEALVFIRKMNGSAGRLK